MTEQTFDYDDMQLKWTHKRASGHP